MRLGSRLPIMKLPSLVNGLGHRRGIKSLRLRGLGLGLWGLKGFRV